MNAFILIVYSFFQNNNGRLLRTVPQHVRSLLVFLTEIYFYSNGKRSKQYHIDDYILMQKPQE